MDEVTSVGHGYGFKCGGYWAQCDNYHSSGGDCTTPGHCIEDDFYNAGDPVDWEDLHSSCQKSGMDVIDEVSYVYTGQVSIDPEEERRTSIMRIFGDNELEGDEWWDSGASGDHAIKKTRIRSTRRVPDAVDHWFCAYPDWKCITMYPPASGGQWLYRYVGGLDDEDNHGRDGISVLYLDWHAETDGRAWPSPIGCRDYESWNKLTWGEIATLDPMNTGTPLDLD
jgi:hypothetical protein